MYSVLFHFRFWNELSTSSVILPVIAAPEAQCSEKSTVLNLPKMHRERKVPLRFTGSLGRDRMRHVRTHNLPAVRRVELNLPQLPQAWDGLKVLQISDVHAGPFTPVERSRQIGRLAAGLGADLIVFTGDQLDRRPSDAERFIEGFRGLEAPLGVWGILGNHDHSTDPDLAVWALQQAGIKPLVNQSITFSRANQSLALIGLDDLQSSGGGPDFNVIRQHGHAFRVALCHQPNGWHQASNAGAHLTLAGHTHGGQIALTARHLNAARFETRYIAGPYRREDAFLYVSRGVGVGAIPVRFGAPPEIDLLTLHAPARARRQAA